MARAKAPVDWAKLRDILARAAVQTIRDEAELEMCRRGIAEDPERYKRLREEMREAAVRAMKGG